MTIFSLLCPFYNRDRFSSTSESDISGEGTQDFKFLHMYSKKILSMNNNTRTRKSFIGTRKPLCRQKNNYITSTRRLYYLQVYDKLIAWSSRKKTLYNNCKSWHKLLLTGPCKKMYQNMVHVVIIDRVLIHLKLVQVWYKFMPNLSQSHTLVNSTLYLLQTTWWLSSTLA